MRRAAGFLGVLGLLVALPWAALRAAPLSPDPVVLRVGQRELRQSALEARLRRVPRYQLRTFGAGDSAAIRGFTETVVAREALLDAAADAPELRQRPDVAWAIRRALANTLVASLDQEVSAALIEADLKHHFETHRDKYRSPERLLLWRIVVSRREDAQAIIGKVQGRNGVAIWEEAARDSSEDRTNHLRGGNLGFVEPSGQTEWPQLRVDPALFAAARTVPDGAVVPKPIALAGRFCIVWRRGSLPARDPSFEEVRAEIRRALLLQRRGKALGDLISRLRGKYLSAHDPAPTQQVPPVPLLELGSAMGTDRSSKR